MLTDKSIDNLLKPFIDRQTEINEVALKKIADRLSNIKTLLPSDIYKLERLIKSGADIREINKEISRLSKLQVKEIKRIIKMVAADYYDSIKPYYTESGLNYIPFEENKPLQDIITAVQIQTVGTYVNISNTAAYAIRDITNPLLLYHTTPAKTYQKFIDMAIQSVILGMDTYDAAINKSIKDLINNGLQGKVRYETEQGKIHYRRLDSVVRQNILDGIRSVQQQISLETGKQFGSDGIELSVHENPAPDHAPIQGHTFTNEEFEKLQSGEVVEDVLGNKFMPQDRAIGEWNCRHIAMSIVLDISTPTYTQEELQEILDRNDVGYTYIDNKGIERHLTMYECTQKRNEYELKLKQYKEGKAFAKQSGNEELFRKYHNKYLETKNIYETFCKNCGLKVRPDRLKIYM